MSFEKAGRLKGHKASVCCIAALPAEPSTLVSGGEDGALCSFDLRSERLVARIQIADEDVAVPSIVADPSNADCIYCCSESDLLLVDRRKDGAGSCIWRHSIGSDEANSVSVSADGRLLACADDSGCITIIDPATRSTLKALKDGHSNIASSVVFPGRNSWQVVSGGLDCQLLSWSVSAGKPLQRWKMGSIEGVQEGAQVCNPPMVHALACSIGEEGSALQGVVAAARGDGVIALYDTAAEVTTGKQKRSCRQSKDSPLVPIFARQSHQAAVSCICFSPAGQGQTILSGGNDGKIVLQHWAKQTPATNSHGDLALASPDDQMCIGLLHGRKVNYLASELSSAAELYVADVSKHVTIYKCR